MKEIKTMTQQVSDAYLLGIKEGRSFLTSYPDTTTQEIKQHVESLKRLMRRHDGPMKQLFKGELDFWKNQLKKG